MSPEPGVPPRPRDLVGRTLGDFVVRAALGEGGHGVVYRAEQPALGREAVIKVIQTRLQGSGELVQRFLREARLASKLDHPYAAHVYAFGAEPDGLLWIAMELVRGTPLDRVLAAQGPMPLERFVPFFERLCEVVHTAHEQGIVHRDLKPANVMVIARAGRVLPKLLDLGIAKATDVATSAKAGDEENALATSAEFPAAEVPAETTPSRPGVTTPSGADLGLTQRGEIVGSPRYMAPEQWVNVSVDARADIYSLGVLAYELLTGRRPFAGSTMKALAKAHARSPVPPLGDGFPTALHEALSRGMAKKAADRFPTAIELAASVRAASGLEAEREALPRLDEETRAAALTEAPQPIADAVAALDQARNGHQLREALWEVVAVLCHLLGILALGCRSRLAQRPESEMLLALTRRSLSDAEWLELARELCRPFAQEREAFPMPELATFVLDGRGELEAMATAERTGSFSEEQLRPILAKQMAALGRVLRATSFLADYRLVSAREDATVDLWAGPRRAGPRALALTGGSKMTPGSVGMVDGAGQPVLLLSPLVQLHPPTPGSPEELFFFAGKGRRGARFLAPPRGFEHTDETFWGWFREHLFPLPGETETTAAEITPYRGLASFTRDDAALFFGREAESDAFRNRLRVTPLLAVVGPSGAGKSSFVEAGVVPNLPPDTLALRVRPGAAPLAALAARLDAENAPEAATPGDRLRALARARRATVLLIVDQSEELFTLCLDEDERRAYARALVDSARANEEPVRVVLTLRDDFLVRATELGAFRDRIAQGLQILTTPAREDLLRIVTLPAERAGYRFEDADMPARMVDAVAGRSGALALLSFTAARLWELRDRHFKQLPRKAYDAIGGVAGALAQHAEATREALPPDEQRLLRDAFRALVTAEGTRAVLLRSELLEVLGDTPSAARVVDRLVDARLLVTAETEQGATIEVIHEALLSAWPRLVEWRREDAEGARLRDQLRAASRQWDERERAAGLLWRGDALAEFERWRARYPGQLTQVEAAFGDASTAESRRSRRNRRLLVGAIFAGLSVALAVALVLRSQATEAQGRAEEAQAQTERDLVKLLQDQGRRLLLDDNVLQAYPYLAAAYRRQGPSVGLMYMLGRARRIVDQQIAVVAHQGIVWDLALSPDGKTLYTSSDDKTIRLWDLTGRELAVLRGHESDVTAIAVSPDGRTLASGGVDGRLLLWDVASRRVRAELKGHTGQIISCAFDSAGTRLVSASADMTVRLWNVSDPSAPPFVLSGHTGGVRSASFIHGDTEIASSGADGDVRRWRVLDGASVGVAWSGGAQIRSMPTSRDGGVVGWGTSTGVVGTLDVATGRIWTTRGHRGELLCAAMSPDGGSFLSSSGDGTTLLWSLRPEMRVTALQGHRSGVFYARFSDDGKWIATGGHDASAIIWNARTQFPEARLSGHTATIRRVAFDRTGELLATGSVDGTARLWRPRSPDLRREWAAHQKPIRAIAMNAAGELVATVGDDGWLKVWRAGTWDLAGEREMGEGMVDVSWGQGGDRLLLVQGSRAKTIVWPGLTDDQVHEHDSALAHGCMLPDGNAVLGDKAGSLVEWSPTGKQPPVRWKGHTQEVSSVSCTARGILSSSADFNMAIWPRAGAEPTRIFAEAEIVTARWNPKSADEILIAPFDPSARVWSLSQGRAVRVLSGHTGPLTDAAYDPSGLLLTASMDGTVRLWDPANGASVGALRRGSSWPIAVVSGPFGVLSAGRDGTLTWWDTTPEVEPVDSVDRIVSCRVPYRIQGESLVVSKLDCGK